MVKVSIPVAEDQEIALRQDRQGLGPRAGDKNKERVEGKETRGSQREKGSEQFAGAQALAKIRGGKDEDAVLGAATLRFQAYNEALFDPWVILYEGAEAA